MKCCRPYFGNVYDLMTVSIIMNKSYLDHATSIIKNKGVKVERLYTQVEYDELASKHEECLIKTQRLEKIIDRYMTS